MAAQVPQSPACSPRTSKGPLDHHLLIRCGYPHELSPVRAIARPALDHLVCVCEQVPDRDPHVGKGGKEPRDGLPVALPPGTLPRNGGIVLDHLGGVALVHGAKMVLVHISSMKRRSTALSSSVAMARFSFEGFGMELSAPACTWAGSFRPLLCSCQTSPFIPPAHMELGGCVLNIYPASCPGVGRRPSCCSRLSMSPSVHCSTILPPTIR